MPVDIDRDMVAQRIGDELELAIAEFGSSCEVEISDRSLDRAADAVCDHFAEEQAEQNLDLSKALEFVESMKVTALRLRESTHGKRRSNYHADLMDAGAMMYTVNIIENTLSEVGL